jgi:hypothetical protein
VWGARSNAYFFVQWFLCKSVVQLRIALAFPELPDIAASGSRTPSRVIKSGSGKSS